MDSRRWPGMTRSTLHTPVGGETRAAVKQANVTEQDVKKRLICDLTRVPPNHNR